MAISDLLAAQALVGGGKPFRPKLNYPEFNGHRISRTSCQLRFKVLDLTPEILVQGWKSITVKEELTPGYVYGSNPSAIRGRTDGKYTANVDMEVYAEDAELVRAWLNDSGEPRGLGVMQVSFQMALTAFEKALGGALLFEAFDCRIVSEELAVPDNDDQLVQKWSLHCMKLRKNGISSVAR